MIKRIVRMSFQPSKTDDFKKIYGSRWKEIRSFKGCKHVELLQDRMHANVFFTYSIWDSEDDLNSYRDSALFEQVWSTVKPLFNDKPMAWSVDEVNFSPLDP